MSTGNIGQLPGLLIGSYSSSSPVGTPPQYFHVEQQRNIQRTTEQIEDEYSSREPSDTLLGNDEDDGCHDNSINEESSQEGTNDKDVIKAKMTARQIITLIILFSGNISSAMFYSLLAPFFPTEATRKGATLYEVGLIFGCFSFIQFIMSPIFGTYMTKLGSKYLFVSGNFICSGCGILFGLLEWCPNGRIYVMMCFILRSIEAVGSAAQITATFTIGAYTFPHHISTVMGLLQASSCIGLVAGPPIGGLLFAKGGFHLPFVSLGALFMFFTFASFFFLPSPKQEVTRPTGGARAMLKLLRNPIVPLVGYIVIVGQSTIGFIDVALAEYLNFVKPGLSTVYIGLIFLIPAGLVVLTAPIVGLLTDKHKSLGRPFLLFGCMTGAVSFLGVGPSPLLTFLPPASVPSIIISLVVSAFGWGALVVTYQQFVTAAKADNFADGLETQGVISGLNGAFSSFGALLGPTVGGVLYQQLGFPWASTAVAFSVLLGAVLLLIYMVMDATCYKTNNRVSTGDVDRPGVDDDDNDDDEPLLTA